MGHVSPSLSMRPLLVWRILRTRPAEWMTRSPPEVARRPASPADEPFSGVLFHSESKRPQSCVVHPSNRTSFVNISVCYSLARLYDDQTPTSHRRSTDPALVLAGLPRRRPLRSGARQGARRNPCRQSPHPSLTRRNCRDVRFDGELCVRNE